MTDPDPSPPETAVESKPFWEHVEELRRTLIRMALTLAAAMVLCFAFGSELFDLFLEPLRRVEGLTDPLSFLVGLGVADPLTLRLRLAFYGGLVLSLPLQLLFVGQFVLPALTRAEKKLLLPGLAAAVALFAAGAAFAYFWLLPAALNFFFSDARRLGIRAQWAVTDYFSFVTNFTIAFGLAFELPVVVLALNRLGLLPSRLMRSGRRYAVILIVVFAAVITPTTDAFTLLALSGPLLVLYEICVWICWWTERRRAST